MSFYTSSSQTAVFHDLGLVIPRLAFVLKLQSNKIMKLKVAVLPFNNNIPIDCEV